MLKEHTPVWVWDGYWWPAIVIALDPANEMIIVRFENGVTAPMKASDLRGRDVSSQGEHSDQSPNSLQPRSAAKPLPGVGHNSLL